MMLALMITVAVGIVPGPQADATRLVVSQPTTVLEIDGGKMKGDLTRMAWSPDGRSVYFQTVERDTRGNVNVRHFVLAFDQKEPKGVDQEPSWAAAYWSAKSAQSAPGMAGLKIAIDQQQKRVAATASPMGGDMAKGGVGGSSIGDAVGEFVNTTPLPGWAADGARLIYLERSGRKKYLLKTLDITIPRS